MNVINVIDLTPVLIAQGKLESTIKDAYYLYNLPEMRSARSTGAVLAALKSILAGEEAVPALAAASRLFDTFSVLAADHSVGKQVLADIASILS